LYAPIYQLSLTYLERQKCYGPDKKILFIKQLFDLEVKGQGPTKVIMVRDTPPYGHAPTYQLSLTYLERQKCYGPDKKILYKKQLFILEVKVPRRSLWYAYVFALFLLIIIIIMSPLQTKGDIVLV
jgi:hypothetical protein